LEDARGLADSGAGALAEGGIGGGAGAIAEGGIGGGAGGSGGDAITGAGIGGGPAGRFGTKAGGAGLGTPGMELGTDEVPGAVPVPRPGGLGGLGGAGGTGGIGTGVIGPLGSKNGMAARKRARSSGLAVTSRASSEKVLGSTISTAPCRAGSGGGRAGELEGPRAALLTSPRSRATSAYESRCVAPGGATATRTRPS
jgi:hypothetical protein